MAVEVTPRAVEVLKRAFELGRMDPSRVGVRVSVAKGLRGEEVRTGFAEGPEPDETTVESDGIMLFVAAVLAERGAVIDVAAEHDQITVR
jgi:hypothetical protein